MALQEADGLGGYPLAPSGEAETLCGRATHANTHRFYAQSFGQVPAHHFPIIPYLRAFADDHRVHVRNLPGLSDDGPGLAQELYRVRVSVPFVDVGEVVTDVFEAGRPEQGVGDGVGEDVSV